jgi:hypothetical protein
MAADPFGKNTPAQNSGTMTESGTNVHPQAPAAGAQPGAKSIPGPLGSDPPKAGAVPDSLPADYTEVGHVTLSSPGGSAVGDALYVRIGSIYKLEGIIDGKPVVYIGKANEIKVRIGSNVKAHKWGSLVKDPQTKVSIRKVSAKLDVEASGGKSVRSAQNEALLSQEEKSLQQTEQQVKEYNENLKPGQAPKRILNEPRPRPATEENVEIWQKRHNVTSEEEWDVIKMPGSSTIVFRVFIGVQIMQIIVDALLQERNRKMARYRWATYVFLEKDGESSFTLESEGEWWGFVMHYRKSYISGPRQGTKVEIPKEEFNDLKDEAHALYGDVDFWGDFIPGMLVPELPVVPAPFDYSQWA